MDLRPEDLASFIGKPATELPTPAFVLSKEVLERNTRRLLQDVEAAGIGFRPHVKTLKCTEITRLMLGRHTSAVASTLREIRALLPLVQERRLRSVLYGVPLRPGALPDLQALRCHVEIEVLLDHEAQVDALEAFVACHANGTTNRTTNNATTNGSTDSSNGAAAAAAAAAPPWPAFIKLDIGTQRAGLPPSSPRLAALVARVTASPAIRFRGFYTHAGHAYAARSADAAAEYLAEELEALTQAAALVPVPAAASWRAERTRHTHGRCDGDGDGDDDDDDDDDDNAEDGLEQKELEQEQKEQVQKDPDPLLLSLGSTPTAHALSSLSSFSSTTSSSSPSPHLPKPWHLELHAGNYPVNDLQQVGTGAVASADMAARVLVDVCSVYPERDEALVNGGVLALGREVGALGGYARVVGDGGADDSAWVVARLSQEHGILCRESAGEGKGVGVEETFHIGQKLWLHVQHACITAAAYPCYFVVDSGDVVREIWWGWRGW